MLGQVGCFRRGSTAGQLRGKAVGLSLGAGPAARVEAL